MGDLRSFFTKDDEQLIVSAIQTAERNTSGEIRVRIEKLCGKDPMKVARRAFEKLGMRETELHNGVLFLLSIEDKKFVILGDDGINDKVPKGFWDDVKDTVIAKFKEGLFSEGLSDGIQLSGRQLAEFFPCQKDDIDELSNSISYADENVNKDKENINEE